MVCGAEFRAETCATAEKELQLQNSAKFVALARNDDFCTYHGIDQRHLELLKNWRG